MRTSLARVRRAVRRRAGRVARAVLPRRFAPPKRQPAGVPARVARVVPEPGCVPVTVAGWTLMARPDPGLPLARLAQANLDLVVDVLEPRGIPYFLVRGLSTIRQRVAIPVRHRDEVLDLLAKTYAQQAVYVASLGAGKVADILPAADLPPAGTRDDAGTTDGAGTTDDADPPGGGWREADVLRVFRVYAAASGRPVGGGYGCDVEFWAEEDGDWVGLRRNRVARRVPAALAEPIDVRLDGRAYRTLAPFAAPLADDVDFPVDVVYTWVDGSDPAWLARKQQRLDAMRTGGLNALATDPARFVSRDELRYSLRSLDRHAPFVRTVYVVTDGQVPPWLRTDHPRLRVVDHREIFADLDVLPTFNSHAIESQLHHIDGLAEHYLYLNDDVFFGRPLTATTFFHGNGLAKFFYSERRQVDLGAPDAGDNPTISAGKNNRALLEREFGRTIVRVFQHVAHPQRRSVLLEMEERFRSEFDRTAAHPFRHPEDISVASSLHHYYAYLTGRAVPDTLRYAYVDLDRLAEGDELAKALPWGTLDVFCLNEKNSDGANAEVVAHAVRGYLDRYLPHKSRFERGTTVS